MNKVKHKQKINKPKVIQNDEKFKKTKRLLLSLQNMRTKIIYKFKFILIYLLALLHI